MQKQRATALLLCGGCSTRQLSTPPAPANRFCNSQHCLSSLCCSAVATFAACTLMWVLGCMHGWVRAGIYGRAGYAFVRTKKLKKCSSCKCVCVCVCVCVCANCQLPCHRGVLSCNKFSPAAVVCLLVQASLDASRAYCNQATKTASAVSRRGDDTPMHARVEGDNFLTSLTHMESLAKFSNGNCSKQHKKLGLLLGSS